MTGKPQRWEVLAARQICARGHGYTPENTRYSRNHGGRICRECARERKRELRARPDGEYRRKRIEYDRQRYAKLRAARRGNPHVSRPWSLDDRLASKYVVDDATGCWVWISRLTRGGYGAIEMRCADGKKRERPAHRVMFEHHTFGAMPEGMVLDHLCRNTICVNPEHLELVSQAENARRNALAAHCRRGHEMTIENTKYKANGNRVCRTCNRMRERERREAKMAERDAARAANDLRPPRPRQPPSIVKRAITALDVERARAALAVHAWIDYAARDIDALMSVTERAARALRRRGARAESPRPEGMCARSTRGQNAQQNQ